jgi:YebC/PmpR family DNA-binding regulatory protein
MAGHSKWANIKHKKGAADARRGKIFTKLIKEITVAARMGGGDINSNPRLRTAVLEAKSENMPKDNIERAIKKGTGELESVNYEEITYEGYGPGGAAVYIESLTDNRNRAVAEIRHIFSKYGGNLGENGCVAWMFIQKGYFAIDRNTITEEKLMEITLDAGAEDVREAEDVFEVITAPEDYNTVQEALDAAKIVCQSRELTRLPENTVELSGKQAEQMIRLMEMLEDCDDVQKTFTNADIIDRDT